MCSVPLLPWPPPFISGRSEYGSRRCLSTEMTGLSVVWHHAQNFGFRVRTTGYKSWFCHSLALWLGQILYLLWILFPVYRMVWYNHLYQDCFWVSYKGLCGKTLFQCEALHSIHYHSWQPTLPSSQGIDGKVLSTLDIFQAFFPFPLQNTLPGPVWFIKSYLCQNFIG